jgi:hypothetical protein
VATLVERTSRFLILVPVTAGLAQGARGDHRGRRSAPGHVETFVDLDQRWPCTRMSPRLGCRCSRPPALTVGTRQQREPQPHRPRVPPQRRHRPQRPALPGRHRRRDQRPTPQDPRLAQTRRSIHRAPRNQMLLPSELAWRMPALSYSPGLADCDHRVDPCPCGFLFVGQFVQPAIAGEGPSCFVVGLPRPRPGGLRDAGTRPFSNTTSTSAAQSPVRRRTTAARDTPRFLSAHRTII